MFIQSHHRLPAVSAICSSIALALTLAWSPANALPPEGVGLSPNLIAHSVQGMAVSDGFGWLVSGVGDVNGDGLGDYLVAEDPARAGGGAGGGRIHIIYGSRGDAGRPGIRLDQHAGFTIDHAAVPEMGIEGAIQRTATGAGDVNGDGYSDIIVSSMPSAPLLSSGAAHVIYGSPLGVDVDLRIPLPRWRGFMIRNPSWLSTDFGSQVAGVGDVNGDGFDDVAVSEATEHFVIFGGGNRDTVDTLAMPRTVGFRLLPNPADNVHINGTAIAGAGDFNGDGYSDVVVSAPGPRLPHEPVNRFAAQLYVVHGGAVARDIPLAMLGGGLGLRVRHAEPGTQFGYDVASVGDYNGDGRSDLLVSAPNHHSDGHAFLIFGRDGGVLEMNRFDVNDGWIIESGDSGFTPVVVGSAGDLNQDGRADLLFGDGINPDVDGRGMAIAWSNFAPAGRRALPARHQGLYAWDTFGRDIGYSIGHMGDSDGDGVSELLLGMPSLDGADHGWAIQIEQNGFVSPNDYPRYSGFVRDRKCPASRPGVYGSAIGTSGTGADHAWSWSRMWVRSCGGTGRSYRVSASLGRAGVGFNLPTQITLPFSWRTSFEGDAPAEVEVTVRYLAHRMPAGLAERLISVHMRPARGGEIVPARITRRDNVRDTISFMVPTATAMDIGFGAN